MGQMEAVEEGVCKEWQEGVLRAERPAERAMWRRGTGGRESRELCVCMKRFERSDHRLSL